MICFGFLLLSVALATTLSGQAYRESFEDTPVGSLPAGWFVPVRGWRARVVAEEAKGGERSLELLPGKGATPIGNVMRRLEAGPYRGRAIRLRAWVRAAGPAGTARAQLWLAVDREGGRAGFFDNAADRPVQPGGWQQVEILGEVAQDAVAIRLGLLALGGARAWLDDLTLEAMGPSPAATAEKPRRLTETGLAHLLAFTRLLGYVRHFHPSDAAARTDWTHFAVMGVRAVEGAKDLRAVLLRLFRPVAPLLQIYRDRPPPIPSLLTHPPHRPGLHAVLWEHYGYGQEGRHPLYRSRRLRGRVADGRIRWRPRLPEARLPGPQQPFVADLGAGLQALIPLVLYADAGGTLPYAPAAKAPAQLYTPLDRATRLATVILLWNVLEHFYPYHDVVQGHWEEGLPEALQGAATAADELAFLRVLRKLLARLQDGHGEVVHTAEPATGVLPCAWDLVEGKLVITHALPGGPLRRGDVVRAIQGRPVKEVLQEEEQYVCAATPQHRRFKVLERLLRGPAREEVRLTVVGEDGRERTVTVRRGYRPVTEPRPAPVAEVRPGVFYLDLGRLDDRAFQRALPRLTKARGIIFDLRGYPARLSTTVLAHLTKKPLQSPRWLVPVLYRPHRRGLLYHESHWVVRPRPPYLPAKRAFLADGRAVSYAETYLGIVEHYRLAEIVGEATAGTNGNVITLSLPGGYRVSFTGMRVLKQDGSRHHGVGIQPTVPVRRTLAGVRAGRDEILEKGIAVVGG